MDDDIEGGEGISGSAARAARDLRVAFSRLRRRIREVRRVLFRSDRKSTRLNSSHLGISYAVFCLKKKKSPTTTGSQRKIIRSDMPSWNARHPPPLVSQRSTPSTNLKLSITYYLYLTYRCSYTFS